MYFLGPATLQIIVVVRVVDKSSTLSVRHVCDCVCVLTMTHRRLEGMALPCLAQHYNISYMEGGGE